MKNKNEYLLKLYRTIDSGTAATEDFELAIEEQGLTEEIIRLIKKYYEDLPIHYEVR